MKRERNYGQSAGSSMPFENTKKKINVLKRQLHIISLLQNSSKSGESWTSAKITGLLNLCDDDKALNEEAVRKYYSKIGEDFEKYSVSLKTSRGSRETSLSGELTEESQLELAKLYSVFTVKDITRDVILNRFIKAKPENALWTIARIFFASKEKKLISFDYTANDGTEKNFTLAPGYLTIYNNNMYLVGKIPGENKEYTLIAERIKNLSVTDNKFDFNIRPAEELFAHSLSAFLPKETGPQEVAIRYVKNSRAKIESIIGKLNPEYTEKEDCTEARFLIADYQYLFKILFSFGKEAEIISPENMRQEMTEKLKECLSVYEKN